MTWTTNTLGS